jgi:DNA end-binding protein Ku
MAWFLRGEKNANKTYLVWVHSNSLVAIEVKIYPAINPGEHVEFHQIDRKTHKRVHHQNVDETGEVNKTDLVKGFEYAKNKYIEIDPEELKALRLPTATTMPIRHFIKAVELYPRLFDQPYVVVPKDEVQAKALSISPKARYTITLNTWAVWQRVKERRHW